MDIPTYDYTQSIHGVASYRQEPLKMSIVVRAFFFWDKRLRDLMGISRFLYTGMTMCALFVVSRDMEERGRSLDSVINPST